MFSSIFAGRRKFCSPSYRETNVLNYWLRKPLRTLVADVRVSPIKWQLTYFFATFYKARDSRSRLSIFVLTFPCHKREVCLVRRSDWWLLGLAFVDCWGHRGASARFPENTLASFEAAIRDGAEGVLHWHTARDLTEDWHSRHRERYCALELSIVSVTISQTSMYPQMTWS